MSEVAGIYHYHRIGHDERELVLCPDGRIGVGSSGAERRWELRPGDSEKLLSFYGDYGEICRLKLESDGSWRGAWLKFERMPIELVPQRLQPLRSLENRGGIKYVPQKFHYISYAQLVQDCAELARSLPPVRAVAGVPRSGLIPASAIALDLNVPMIPLEALFSKEPLAVPLLRRRHAGRIPEGIILVVEDTSASGRQIDHLRKMVKHPVKFAAIYVEDRPKICVDYYHSKLPDFAQFYEWTMLHDVNNFMLLADMDGVLCDDWTGGSEEALPQKGVRPQATAGQLVVQAQREGVRPRFEAMRADPVFTQGGNEESCVKRGTDSWPQQAELEMRHTGRASDPVFTQDSAAYLDFLENVRPKRIPTFRSTAS